MNLMENQTVGRGGMCELRAPREVVRRDKHVLVIEDKYVFFRRDKCVCVLEEMNMCLLKGIHMFLVSEPYVFVRWVVCEGMNEARKRVDI